MKKYFSLRSIILSLLAISLLATVVIITTTSSKAAPTLATKLSGRILLQVEDHGKVWYVSPDNNNQRIQLRSPLEIFCFMKTLGLGISNNDLNNYLNTTTNKFPTRLSGKILLAVEQYGEAYYINPLTLQGHYLGRPQAALNLMKGLALGVFNDDLNTIDILDTTKILENYNIIIKPNDQEISKIKEKVDSIITNIFLVTQEVAPMNNFSHIVSISTIIDNPNNLVIKEKGLLYDYTFLPDNNLNPTLDKYNKKIISKTESNNSYTLNVTDLSPRSYPFIRAYLIAEDNHIIYGNTVTIISVSNGGLPALPVPSSSIFSPMVPILPWKCGDSFKDTRDNNVYKTIDIGGQCWFQENLKETKYFDGTSISNLESIEDWIVATSGAYVWYKNNKDDYESYGALYSGVTVVEPQGLCPAGWHVPSKMDFEELKEFLGADSGFQMKSSSWDDGDSNSKFLALPVGARGIFGGAEDENYFGLAGAVTGFWSTTETRGDSFFSGNLILGENNFVINSTNKLSGLSVRCLKNSNKTLTYIAGENGTVNSLVTLISEEVNYGEDGSSYEAIPNDGYKFYKWSDGSKVNPRKDINVISNVNVTAMFTLPFDCETSLSDNRDNNSYKTVKIGDQCWFQENLRYLPMVHSNDDYAASSSAKLPAYGVYGYNGSDLASATSSPYYSNQGVLYNWYAAIDTLNNKGEQGLCPDDWHIPSDKEWTELARFVIGGSTCDPTTGGGCDPSGHKLKASSSTTPISWDGDNDSRFTALRTGERLEDGSFQELFNVTRFWSYSKIDSDKSWTFTLKDNSSEVSLISKDHFSGFAIRCLKN